VLKQVQRGKAFMDPVPVTITTASGKRDIVLQPTSQNLVKTISLREKPLKIEVDPRNTLLKEASVREVTR